MISLRDNHLLTEPQCVCQIHIEKRDIAIWVSKQVGILIYGKWHYLCGSCGMVFSSGSNQNVGYAMAWASCQIRKIAGAHAPGMPGTFSPSPPVSDPDMHHGTCVTHVPWCMPGSLTSGFLWNRRRGKTFPAFPAHAQPAILRIW